MLINIVDKYLVVLSSLRNKNITRALDKIWESIEEYPNIKIKDCDKFRFNSDIDLPLNTAIEFRSLVINVSCIIEKDIKYYTEIYLDECLYVKDITWYAKSLFSECIKFRKGELVFPNIK